MTRLAVFSDLHGNLPAAERFVASTRGRVDGYVCLGDVVDYGPWGDECVDLVASLPGIVWLEGNHERLFLGTEPLDDEAPLVQTFIAHSRATFTRFDGIRGLPLDYTIDDVVFTHTIDGRRIYPDTVINTVGKWVIGHSHHQFRTETSIDDVPGWVVNVGSLGQNRRYIDAMNYAIYDSENQSFEMCEERSDIDIVISEMERRDWAPECIAYYRTKGRRFESS